MTEKLYYNDPFCKTFTATVRACVQEKDACLRQPSHPKAPQP